MTLVCRFSDYCLENALFKSRFIVKIFKAGQACPAIDNYAYVLLRQQRCQLK